MKLKKKHIALIILFICSLVGVIYVANNKVNVSRRLSLMFSKTGSRISTNMANSKEIGTFLWEYEILEPEVDYRDSVRHIHFRMKEAFAEKMWGLIKDVPNYLVIDSISRNGCKVIIPYEYLGEQKRTSITGLWRANFSHYHSNAAFGWNVISIYYKTYPPDTIREYILVKEPDLSEDYYYDQERDTLIEITLIRKY